MEEHQTFIKDPLLERAQEIIGEIAVQGLINPYDSDYINDNKENNVVEDILLEDKDNKNDPNDVFLVSCILLVKKYLRTFFKYIL